MKTGYDLVENFRTFIDKNKITQVAAATELGISKGQLCHILKGERSVSAEVAVGMRKMMGEKVMGFEECRSRYPLGSYSIRWVENATYLFQHSSVPRLSKEQVLKVEDLYCFSEDEEDGLDFSFVYKDPKTNLYAVGEIWGFKVIGYMTEDGITFRPLLERGLDTYSKLPDLHLEMPVVYNDFSNFKEVWEEVCEKISGEYEFYFTKEEFDKEEKK